jgi:hypothetical protein
MGAVADIGGGLLDFTGAQYAADGQKVAGKQQKAAAYSYAAGLDQQAGQAQAASQRTAIQRRREGNLVASRVRAVAAASGAGVTDPTIIGLGADIENQADYNVATALYEGNLRAHDLTDQANMARYGGRQAKKASQVLAQGTMLAGYGSLLDAGGKAGAKIATWAGY